MKGKKECRADGGRTQKYTPDNNVEKEAEERKRGGAVKGKHKKHEDHRVEGKMSKMRLDRPGRKSGGRVGSDKSPLSSAAKVSSVSGHSTDD